MITISLSACWIVYPQGMEVFGTAFENIFALLNSRNIFAIKWFIIKHETYKVEEENSKLWILMRW